MTEVLFGSDNQAGMSPEVMEAVLLCGKGIAVAYGDDAYSARINAAFSEIFERETFVISTTTGAATDALGLSVITPPYGGTICHEAAHILTTEGGAAEFYAGGSRLFGMSGASGKITPHALVDLLNEHDKHIRHKVVCSSLSLTQATELGTVYSVGELEALSSVAHDRRLRVHMDGARFANALVALKISPCVITWRVGLYVLSLGTTKNGAMNAEAVVVFDGSLAPDLALRQKISDQFTSKMRYVSAQFLAQLDNVLWLRNAQRANDNARTFAAALECAPGVRPLHPVQTNQTFADIPPAITEWLAHAGLRFRVSDHQRTTVHRLVASFQDNDGKIAKVKTVIHALSRAA